MTQVAAPAETRITAGQFADEMYEATKDHKGGNAHICLNKDYQLTDKSPEGDILLPRGTAVTVYYEGKRRAKTMLACQVTVDGVPWQYAIKGKGSIHKTNLLKKRDVRQARRSPRGSSSGGD